MRRLFPIITALALFLPGLAAASAPRVVASIAPVDSLVAAVMAGVGKPYLLVRGGASPHTYTLRPSDARAVANARVVFWIGPDLETFLVRPLANLGRNVRRVALMDAPGVERLPARRGGAWERDPDELHGHVGEAELDPHVWLDPQNAAAMVHTIVATLSEVDPAHAALYRANGKRTVARLHALDSRLAAQLADVHHRPFIVFHDAFHYFDNRYGLEAVGSVVVSPDRPTGARRVLEIRRRIVSAHAVCAFTEPQFSPALMATITEGLPIRTAALDPLGAALKPGPDLYFKLLHRIADDLHRCLAPSNKGRRGDG